MRTESLPTAVSVAGKRDFLAREKYASTSPEPRISGLRDQAVAQEARQFGAFLKHYRKSPQPPECVVGLAGLKPQTRPLWRDHQGRRSGTFSTGRAGRACMRPRQ